MISQTTHSARPVLIVLTSLLLSLGLVDQAAGLQIHQQILGPFTSVHDVTLKCLECHRQQAEDVLQSTHWTWVRQRTVTGNNNSSGKIESLAGFAIDVTANGQRCLPCHISISPGKESFTSPAADMVDCLACHDTTGMYQHTAGTPRTQPDFVAIARNVGQPTAKNCMGCHFADCGLAPVNSQKQETRSGPDIDDIHMRSSGPAFTCQECHQLSNSHTLARQTGTTSESWASDSGCVSCHTPAPHALERLNQHSRSITCQACHIPSYARKKPVLVSWNWLMTGKTNMALRAGTGTGPQLFDQNGFWSASDVEPVYLWDDGSDQLYTRGQKIQPQELTVLQQPGEKSANSRLSPFRVLYSTQLYDSKYRYLISPVLNPEGETLFPGPEWDTIARKGMQAIVLPFSGQYGFTATATYRRINHGVAPADQALDCLDCHGSTGRIRWDMLGFEHDPMAASQAEEDVTQPAPQQILPPQQQLPPTGQPEQTPQQETMPPSDLIPPALPPI